jgi:plastocyanin
VPSWLLRVAIAATAITAVTFSSMAAFAEGGSSRPASPRHTVTVPEADKFTPFLLTVRVGDTVKWVNNDTDDHTIVSDNTFNSAGHTGLDHLLPGTDSNGGKPGIFELEFHHAGVFVYFCRFHSHLDMDNQPVAPGPDGGIQDANGNFGTPMMGIIKVMGHARGDDD